ncbi:type II toxin-antitoxin system VapC family toxin [bacterium]|nr:type II toxin-antitoxin system VapC family toxin [bacterium]
MEIVTDTSVIIAVLTNETHKNKLIRLTSGADLIAPGSLHWEIANAFSAMFKRDRINLAQAKKAIDYYRKIPIRFIDVDFKNVLTIASKKQIYAYDAYFLECAKQRKAKLITLDGKLKSIASELNIETIEV